MSYQSYPAPAAPLPEKDAYGGDALPTYDELAAQHGPNSRFGRWREWIEKRSAERYADLTPEELARRRQRGWGDDITTSNNLYDPGQTPTQASHQFPTNFAAAETSSRTPTQLHIETNFTQDVIPDTPSGMPPLPASPAPLKPELLLPSHLGLYQFGSRFLPHTTSPIRCLLPLLDHRLLLIGHDDGLSVVDMFPSEWTDQGLLEKGPSDAEARPIWVGEGVFQMSILESQSTGEGTPQGVVLALCGSEPDSNKEQESVRSLRMYNLASLVSLAKWAVVQKGARPVDMRHTATTKKSSGGKRHKPQSSLAKGLKNLVLDSPIAHSQSLSNSTEPPASYSNLTDFTTLLNRSHPYNSLPSASASTETVESNWDFVEDLPLRWATHYTPLASAGSRLSNTSVIFYDLWQNENQRSRGGALLAVATKSNIFLYETPKGERAFRLLKEFYTPLTARSITFVQQSVQDSVTRSSSAVTPRPGVLVAPNHRRPRVASLGSGSNSYSHQLSLFVIFDKKAGLIRIADAAVGEVELCDENQSLSAFSHSNTRRSRASWDGIGFSKETKALWVPPVKVDLPGPSPRPGLSQSMYILTRGKQSHIVPYPLPPVISAIPPYRVLVWSFAPTHVSYRVCSSAQEDLSSYLQVVAFGEDGVDVHEISLSSISERKGKGRAEETIHVQVDVGGPAGLLCTGGLWHQPYYKLARSDSLASWDSDSSERLPPEEGIYGWVQKGAEDWRIFWVGGSERDNDDDDDENDL